jgi:hypothetical protein
MKSGIWKMGMVMVMVMVMASISASAYTVGFRSVDLLRNVDVLPRYILIFRVFGSVINSFILSEQIVLINQKWFKLQQLVRALEYLKLSYF